MRSIGRYALWGAVIGTVAVTVFAVGEMLGDASREGVPLPVTIILGLSMGGLLIGAPAGAAIGGFVGWIRGRSDSGAPARAPAPAAGTGATAPPQRPQTAAMVAEPTPTTPDPAEKIEAESDPQPNPAQPDRPPLDRDALIESANKVRQRMAAENEAKRPQLLAPVKPAPSPITRSGVDLSDPQRLNRVLDELDALPGLEHVAGQVRGMARRILLDQQRREAGLKVAEQGLHCLFIGPPGTGKTSVARIWGRVLAATGLLPSGHVVEVDRSDLVGQTIGSTGPKTLATVDEAMGGVLFLDEAYSLSPEGATGQDFGGEAIAALLKAMEDKRGQFAVIAAGYEREMATFLESNSGLRSRFSHTVSFPNYSGDALVTISESMADAGDYTWDDDALRLLAQAFTRLAAAPPKGWANARSVRGVLDGAISAQADRLAESDDVNREALTTLTEADARAALQRFYPQAV